MSRRLQLALFGAVGLASAGCSASPSTRESSPADAASLTDAGMINARDAGSDASPDATSPSGADGASDAGAPDASAASDGAVDAGVTPIALAEAWVEGFYGTPYGSTNRYSNTDEAGAPNGYYTVWRGDPGVTSFANVSDCSSFSDTLLTRSYGWIPATTSSRPHAVDYYWAIRQGAGFMEITNVGDIQVGDVIALLYPPGSTDTGHVAWIAGAPAAFAGPPDEPGLTGYAVTVIDSTNGFHDGASGPSVTADDRFLGLLSDGGQCSSDVQCITLYGPNALCNTTQLISYDVCSLMGVGRGQMRLYADASGTIQGHTWSPNSESTYYPRPNPLPTAGGSFTGEDVVVGRYDR
jgi:hypothetical protein